ncbi:hypothetical protein QVD17_07361 [Tagetes erecta]|uniref:LOB domain-containing protein n=1 Tax=Tagetes erecta TaxID=13708 RepID=A0AAD8LF74_TARER|nr:hypothetical protein QVD17_07361 [Tagetes erecta]
MTGVGSSCGACKFLRRKCTSECVFTPYFCYSQGAEHFAAVHKVFGASNVSKLLMKIPKPNRNEAAISISYEALARMHDPIYGCVAQILALEQQVVSLQEEINQLVNNMGCFSFGQPNLISSQELNIFNNELPFALQLNDSNNHDHLNQQTPTLFAAPQDSYVLGNLDAQNTHQYSFPDYPTMENRSKTSNTHYESF